MASVNDVVRLNDGSVGVVGEDLSSPSAQQYRVHFYDSRIDILDTDIDVTLDAPSYSVNDPASLWPYAGTITAIDGDQFTLSIERQQFIEGLGAITWTATHTAPRWRVIRDNDPRIERNWA